MPGLHHTLPPPDRGAAYPTGGVRARPGAGAGAGAGADVTGQTIRQVSRRVRRGVSPVARNPTPRGTAAGQRKGRPR